MTSRTRRACALGLAATLTVGLSACGGNDDGASGGDDGPGKGVSLTIADKGFTESAIIANAYADALEADGFDVKVTSLKSTDIAYPAVKKGDIQMYPDYDGTLFQAVMKKTADDASGGPDGVLEAVKKGVAADGLTVMDPAPFNNGNEVACTEEAVSQNNITDLSSLGAASPKLTYSANAEHLTRADGLPLLKKVYGVNFAKTISVDITLRYTPIEKGQAQCVYAFGTDPQLATLPLVLVKDDKGDFAGAVPYRTVPVVNTAWLDGLSKEARAAFEATIARVNAGLTQKAMPELIAKVDFDKDDPEDVAEEFVKGLGS